MKRACALLPALLALIVAGNGVAQSSYPEKPIHLIVGFPPGGPADALARLLGQRLAEAFGKPVVVENVVGAGGTIAMDRAAKAAPDGYTVTLAVEAQVLINPRLYKVAYDPVRDFAPISEVASSPYMLVVGSAVPAHSLKELIELARAQPGELTYASAGSGSGPHMAAELFKGAAHLDIRHIPYKGVAPAMSDLLGGRVTMMFSPIATALPMVRDGRLRGIAVTSPGRFFAAPELPSVAESGLSGFEMTGWLGLLAPAATSPEIVRTLHKETISALSSPEVRAQLANLGLEGIGNTPGEFAAIIGAGIPKWAKVIEESHAKAD